MHNDDLDDSSDEDTDEEKTPPDKKSPTTKARGWGAIKSNMGNTTKQDTLKPPAPDLSESSIPAWQREAAAAAGDQGVEEVSKEDDGKPKSKFKPSFYAAATALKYANKLKKKVRRPRFNFEKFLSYLESMRPTVGFHIAGIMVTWDLVSTTLFLLFSVIAVFMQESIFGSQKSTIS